MFQKNNISNTSFCQSNAQGSVQNCKKMQKIAEKTRRFAKICKKLQKKYASLHNFFPSAAFLIDPPDARRIEIGLFSRLDFGSANLPFPLIPYPVPMRLNYCCQLAYGYFLVFLSPAVYHSQFWFYRIITRSRQHSLQGCGGEQVSSYFLPESLCTVKYPA